MRNSLEANRKWVERAIERGEVTMELDGNVAVDVAVLNKDATKAMGLPFPPMIRISGKLARAMVDSIPNASVDLAYMWKDALKRQVAYRVDRATSGRLRLLCLSMPDAKEGGTPCLLEFALRVGDMGAEITFCTDQPLPAKWVEVKNYKK